MESSLKWPDYVILVGFLIVSLAIGLYHSLTGGRQRTTNEFIMGNRRLQVIPTAISLLISHHSAMLLLGMTAEMYVYGPQLAFNIIFTHLAMELTVERIIVPWLYPLKLVSVNEYVYLRFGSNILRILASILSISNSIIYMGMSMYAPSAALISVTGIPLWLSIPTMSVVCIVYTVLGGMRAVIWTDVFQFLTMTGGMLAILIQGLLDIGGMGEAVRYARAEDRMDFVDWNFDPTVRHTVWGIMIGRGIGLLANNGISQASVQRYTATKSLTKARLTVLLSIPGTCLNYVLAGLTAIVVFAHYAKIQCDPFQNKDIRNANHLLPHFVKTVFGGYPGFAGLFLATLYGGSLSSVSSSLSASAANCWEDIFKRKLSHLSETKKVVINRVFVVVFGVFAISISFLAAVLPGPVIQIHAGLSGSVGGPILGIILLGGISRLPNWKGVLTGVIIGFLVNIWIVIGSVTVPNKYPTLPPLSVEGCQRNESSASFSQLNSHNFTYAFASNTTIYQSTSSIEHYGIQRFYCLSYVWYAFIGFLITFSVGFVVSLVFREKDKENLIEDRLLIRFKEFICSWSSQEKEQEKRNSDTQKSICVESKEILNGSVESAV